MEQISPIRVSLDTNEAHRARAKKIKAAILRDDHFFLTDPADCPFDLCFQWDGKTINVELKDFTRIGEPQSDYIASIVNQSGHLYQQVLAGRELQDRSLEANAQKCPKDPAGRRSFRLSTETGC